MKILLIDNYDSFTYNLLHLIKKVCGEESRIDIIRNDCLEIEEINSFDKIILSPGPGIPEEAGRLMEVIKCYHKIKPILGICLGHQAIGEFFGAKLLNVEKPWHGIRSRMRVIKRNYLFEGIDDYFEAGRYHSWLIDGSAIQAPLYATSVDAEDNLLMSLSHDTYDLHGLQFHPESILTPCGERLVRNFIQRI